MIELKRVEAVHVPPPGGWPPPPPGQPPASSHDKLVSADVDRQDSEVSADLGRQASLDSCLSLPFDDRPPPPTGSAPQKKTCELQ